MSPRLLELASGGADAPVVIALAVPDPGSASRSTFANRPGDVEDAAIAAAQASVLASLEQGSFTLTHRYRHIPALGGRVTAKALARLAELPAVRAVSLDVELSPYLDSSVPFIGADSVRRSGITGKGRRVAVLDTGVEAGHLDLRDAVAQEKCFLDPTTYCPPAPHVADDSDGHGTHVAGIVAGRGKKASYGVAPGAEIVAVKLIEERNNAAGTALLAALDWLIEQDGLDAVNMSFGGGAYAGECDNEDADTMALAAAFARLRENGVVPVAASGNDGSTTKMGLPACIRHVVSVGAVDESDGSPMVAEFTNRNATLDLLAPGVGVVSSFIGGRTASMQGTSMAAPHVAGAVALMREVAPWAGPDQIEEILERTGQRPMLRYGSTTIRTIDVARAVDELRAMTPTAGATSTSPRPPTATPTPPASPTSTADANRTSTPSPRPSDAPTASETATSSPTVGLSTATPSTETPATATRSAPTATPSAATSETRRAIYLPALECERPPGHG